MQPINVVKTDLPSYKTYITLIKKLWKTHWITNNGEYLQELEKKLRTFLKVKYIIVLSNGTLALQLQMKMLNLSGEVITTPFTFAATTTSIIWEGLTPVFADIDSETYNIDPDQVEKLITPQTSAILAVHVFGNPCNLEKLKSISMKYNLKLIYDAAHAFGVEYKNKSVLKYGDISTLSFHATKTFHTIEGGAVVTNNRKIANKIKAARNFGIIEFKKRGIDLGKKKSKVVLPGINAKMNEFQAAMGLCNLETLEERRIRRKRIYELYSKRLAETKVIGLQKITASKYNYSYMPVCFKTKEIRDAVVNALTRDGIIPRKYFFPLTTEFDFIKKQHLTKKYKLNNAIKIANGILCLPIYSTLSIKIVNRVVNIICSTLDKS